jgi:ABC-2 type transport system ATP-binding protein
VALAILPTGRCGRPWRRPCFDETESREVIAGGLPALVSDGPKAASSRGEVTVLEFDQASKRFGELAALDACSFTARPGRLTGFLGPNGAGKTTAMRTIFGLVALDGGTVTWQDKPIGPQQRARFGYMPEERGLYPRMRVRDQLVYLGRLCGRTSMAVNQTIDTWLERLGLSDRASDRLDALSHGNQQRVQLIAALVNEPELLVLDEPFSGLDPLALTSLSELLAEVAGAGATVLFSSHQLDLVEDICEDVVIINAGRVVQAGDLAGLRAAVPQRFVTVRYRGGAPDWSGWPSVEVVDQRDGEARLRVASNADLAAMAEAAQRDADLVAFTYGAPTLSELFREAVAA